jgi:hypothetical protein
MPPLAFDVAFGGKADIAICWPNVCFWPKADMAVASSTFAKT